MAEGILQVTARSLYISAVASLAAFAAAVLTSSYLARSRRRVELLTPVFESLVGVPTTVVGLLVYTLLSPRGPLGFLKLLYTPYAVMVGEFLVALPAAVAYMARSFHTVREGVRELVLSLGVSSEGVVSALALRELAPTLLTSCLVAFSRAIGELGVALIVGGGIEGYTNVLTTAIALQASIGKYEEAIWTGLVLIAITVVVALAVRFLGERVLWR